MNANIWLFVLAGSIGTILAALGLFFLAHVAYPRILAWALRRMSRR